MKALIRLIMAAFAVVTLSSGALVLDGAFKSARAGAGAVGVVVLGREVYAELIPYRPNRTYYRLVIARSEV
jgi:hypothetical protein